MFRSGRWSLLVALPALMLSGAGASLLEAQQRQPSAAPAPADPVERGRYIVEDVAMCWRCHSPLDAHGDRDRTHWLHGGAVGMRSTVPGVDWAIVAPRIAGAPPGTDAQFVTLMMTGISRTGAPPRQPMPQFHLTQTDAEAVLAYLKSIGGQAKPAAPPAPTLTRK